MIFCALECHVCGERSNVLMRCLVLFQWRPEVPLRQGLLSFSQALHSPLLVNGKKTLIVSEGFPSSAGA